MKYNSFDDSMTFEFSIRLSKIDLQVYCFIAVSEYYISGDCFMLETEKMMHVLRDEFYCKCIRTSNGNARRSSDMGK